MKDLVDGDAVEAEENGETSSSTLTVLLNQDNRTVHQYLFCWVLGQGIVKHQGVIGPGEFWCEGFFWDRGIMTGEILNLGDFGFERLWMGRILFNT